MENISNKKLGIVLIFALFPPAFGNIMDHSSKTQSERYHNRLVIVVVEVVTGDRVYRVYRGRDI